MAAKKKRTVRKKAAPGSAGLDAQGCAEIDASALKDIERVIDGAGGAVVGRYKDPMGGKELALAVIPIDAVEPTPFQRDLSDTHHKRLADVIQKTGRFLDPIICVASLKKGGAAFWTPNGRHRLEAMRRIGAKAITGLVVPDRTIAWQILALNTEKAHNVKERALEVIRIYRGLLDEDKKKPETDFAFYLEDPAFVTIGCCYEKNPRFAAGAYHPILRRVLSFSDDAIGDAIERHEELAALTMKVEEKVSKIVTSLKERGILSPYLRAFVVARINPLKFIKGDPPSAEKVLETMLEKASKFDTAKIKQDDLAKMSGGPPPEED